MTSSPEPSDAWEATQLQSPATPVPDALMGQDPLVGADPPAPEALVGQDALVGAEPPAAPVRKKPPMRGVVGLLAGHKAELGAAIAQLVVVGLLVSGAAVWTSMTRDDSISQGRSDQGRQREGAADSAPKVTAPVRRNPNAGANVRRVTRRVDMASPAASRGVSGAGLEKSQDEDFRTSLEKYAIPAIGATKVHQALERNVDGHRVFRRLRFESAMEPDAMVAAYHRLLTQRGYDMREMMLGQFGGGVTELIGQRGKDRITAQIVPQAQGHRVHVTLEEHAQKQSAW